MADIPMGLQLGGGTLPRISPNASVEEQIAAINNVIDRLNIQLQSQTYSDGTSKRMIIGYQKDGWGTGKDFGIKISKQGFDVGTATDDQLLFKMDMNTWYFYDPTTSKNYMQFGILPDGSGGIATAKTGFNVSEGIF